MRPLETWRIRVDDPFSLGNLSVRQRLVDNLSEVVPYDFRQTSRVDRHDIGAVDCEDIVNSLN